ncbi:WD repeat containing protein [Tubulinosema ratisbonensis]|uniref:WD repeat containing protein n=1 Tax=Tubulinosema ratisbonensis TaxID=291195 RepID=A0A437ALU6_9MICR|nr:WD repeat containing protein [Tubulinosema ratisbonensis]
MHKLESLDRSKIFSLDFKKYLIYATEEGSIKIQNEKNTLINDKHKKDIKIYTKNNKIFTTVDPITGLRIWSEKNVIYTYKHQDMYYHDISLSGLIACTSDYNIRIFDLKQRFSFTNYQFSNAIKCLWKDDYVFYAINSDGISKFDRRNDKKESFVFSDIKDFIIFEESVYFVQQKNKINYLIKFNANLTDNFVSQKVNGNVLCKLNCDEYKIALGGNKQIELIGSKYFVIKSDDIGKVKCMISSEKECFLGTDSGLIKLNFDL